MNPYTGQSFFGFFGVLFKRVFLALTGDAHSLASDEVQLLVLIMIALSSALVGTFLVLKKMTMLANSLSHTVLLGIVGAFLITRGEGIYNIGVPTLLIGALITALCTTFSTEFLHKKLRLQEDTSIGLIFTAFFALGVVLVTTLTRNSHLGIEAIMGNVDALHPSDMKQVFYLFLFNTALVFLFFRRLELLAFDSQLGRNMGISLIFFNYLLMFQTAITAIGSFRAVGAFLFLAFLVAPVLTARFFTHRLKPLLFLAGGIGVLAAAFSVALSRHVLSVYHIPLSTSGLAATVLGAFFVCGIIKRLISQSERATS
ncbi:metal ABC transporter permease [Candidatus Neptunichlamydia sp. REUL1]|uniref:metal ABC transporter permease n=1 Tax=Candidatus Neptunichlamydia sp. REUL1 TaxID=3064277 RepID=UPI00292FCD5B|nr:metal ABC transporter permease [Candidatus Neptunochlamydia sp. REUL1]